MTLQQLRYIVAIAEAGTLSGAAKALFISQPSLTKTVQELENEMGIKIFERTNKGVLLSHDGEIFLGYARQVLEQAALLESHYKTQAGGKQEFRVSTQHYSFAVNAFVDLIKEYGRDTYDLVFRKHRPYEIIRDVADMKSEIGILYMNDFNRSVLEKLFKTHDLVFHELFSTSLTSSFPIPSLHDRDKSPWKNWNHIPTFPTFKGTITPFIFRKRFSVPSYEKEYPRH